MQVFNRNRAIDALVDNDFDFVMSDIQGAQHLRYTFRYGFEGYDSFSDDDLIMECLNRDIPDSYYFDEDEFRV